MRQIDKLLDQYGESHQHTTNILIHGIAVPSIFFVTVGLIYAIPVPAGMAAYQITFAHLIAVPMLIYYFVLSFTIGVAMTLLTVVVFAGIAGLEAVGISVWQFSLVLFVIMWILQFVGHKIEGKKPSFFEDLRFLLVGPAWWWNHFFKRMNIKP